MRPIDDELRTRFDELRDADRASAPEFRAMWDAAQLRQGRSWKPVWMWSAIATAAAAAVVVAVSVSQRWGQNEDVVEPALTISTWTSPTAGLLRTTSTTALVKPSTLGSVLDGALEAR